MEKHTVGSYKVAYKILSLSKEIVLSTTYFEENVFHKSVME